MNGFYLAIGKQGSGKTLFITKLLYSELQEQKRPVFSNYTLLELEHEKITFDNAREEDQNKIDILKKLDEDENYFDNSIMLLDEIHIYFDSLDFMRSHSRRMQVFFSQLRKRNILLLATTQYIMNLDVRIRRQCMNVFDMYHIHEGLFEVTVQEIDGYFTKEISRTRFELSTYYDKYDTKEIIK